MTGVSNDLLGSGSTSPGVNVLKVARCGSGDGCVQRTSPPSAGIYGLVVCSSHTRVKYSVKYPVKTLSMVDLYICENISL